METEQKQTSIIEVLEYCKINLIPARVVGRWVWVEFEDKPDQAVRAGLKAIGFRWSKRRGQWAHNCGNPTKPARGYKPWDKYSTRSLDDGLKAFSESA